MSKILGLDLGTNSIGWAIRDVDTENDNQIIDYGVVIFKKGVGEGKSGEFSLAAERRKNRSKRRLYNAKRYRKWELLKVLIENNMCPLRMDELRLWSIGNWQDVDGKKKNLGRIYPIANEAFQQWLAFDSAYFGHKGEIEKNHKGVASFKRKNPYDIRCELISEEEQNEQIKKHKIGRALYHLVQRRGFKSSRKSGKSAYAENSELEKIKSENENYHIATLAKEKLDKGERFRASGVIQRRYFEDEFFAICEKQNISQGLTDKLYKAIYFVRPLRSQKGLVGNCTLEKSKARIPISHPKFEEFRALQFINNIKRREVGTRTFQQIPISLRKRIFEELFFRRLEIGKNKGKITSDSYFKFDETIEKYSEKGKYEFNYKNTPNVSTCPTIAALMNVFDDEWQNKFITDENSYGINWDGLKVEYELKYGKLRRKIEKGKKIYITKSQGEKRILQADEIWHLLFDYIQTKDKQEDLETFCKNVLGFDENKAKAFSEIDIPQGYGSLSYSAISKIIPFLQSGFIYSEAVSFANLKKVLGEKFESNKEKAKKIIADTIKETDDRKEKLNIVNGLIQNYFTEINTNRAKGVDDHIKEMAAQDTIDKLKKYFGETDWSNKPKAEQKQWEDKIFQLYLKFLDGKQTTEEKASSRLGKNPEIDYYKLPRLDEAIKQNLKNAFNLSEETLKHLYHPSDIEMYPKSKSEVKVRIDGIEQFVKQLESPQPPSKGWKNPMAMRTLHELRHLLNYLLRVGKIDHETKIVVEMARELNDANKRKAIEYWQNDRKKENQEYALAIAEMYKISAPSEDDFNKFKAAIEQLVEKEKSTDFQKKYNDFIDTFLVKKNKKGEEISGEETETISYDYLMYLILTRDEFIKLLQDQPLGIGRILNVAKDFKNKRNAVKEMLIKFRLWNEQKFQCFYTGQQISFTELFSPSYQIEHTIPRSISFDSELKNLTVCDATYNSQVKNNRFPTECPNLAVTKKCKTVKGEIDCSPITDRVERMIKPKVDELEKRIKNLKVAMKKIPSWDIDKRNSNIRLRHYLQFELEYWEKKHLTFTIDKKDWKDNWKNSQLVDTQIISKYARAYLKTVFEKVDVQKGTIVNDFKKIYQIKGDEKKDRSKHSHHALDAATLSLIPGSARREAILKKYYTAIENKQKYHAAPYEKFKTEHILRIGNNVIINHVPHDKTLTKTFENITKRGKKTGWIAQGDTIRGQLHKETFFGAVKALERNEQGFPIKENGKYKIIKNAKTGEDEIWIVSRKPIKDVKLEKGQIKDVVVDELLKQHIQKQLDKGVALTNVVDFNHKPIRHIRMRVKAGVGYLSKEKAMAIKKHTYTSKHQHKKEVLAQNEENYLFLLYEGQIEKKAKKKEDEKKTEIVRHYRILNLLEIAQLGIKNINELKKEPEFQTIIKGKVSLPLKVILKTGDRVIFFKENRDEVTNENINSRLYKLYKFNEKGSPFLYFQHHLEARPDAEIEKAGNIFDSSKSSARLELVPDKTNCLFEGTDFEIKPDGEIIMD